MDNAPLHPGALKAAVEQNLRTYQELKKLSQAPATLMSWSPDYANYYPAMITRLQRLYRDLQAAYAATEYAQEEGILEITLRSRTQTVSWPIAASPGAEIADKLLEYLALSMQEVEDKIIEARGRFAGEYPGGTVEEWHTASVRYLALLLEEMPTLPSAA